MGTETTKCLLCGGNAELRHSEFPGYKEPDSFSIFHCPNCNTAFALPRKETSSIYEDIYNNADRVPGYQRYRKYARSVLRSADPLKYLAETSEVYWSVTQALPLPVPGNPLKILELGSGLGYLTYALSERDYDITGLDISESAVRKARETFGDHYKSADIHEFARSNREAYDYVISTEVIEHFENITHLIYSILELLKPGGKAIITTPNKSFFPADIIWATDQPPVHYWWLSEESFKYLSRQINSGISFIDFTPYYRKNHKVTGLKAHHNGRLPRAVFNREGDLTSRNSGSLRALKLDLDVIVSGIPVIGNIGSFLKRIVKNSFANARNLFEKDTLVCDKRGITLCAVLTKGK